MYKVYIEIDSKNRIVDIFSSLFKTPSDTSIFIDEGEGDRYVHVGGYLPLAIHDDIAFNYKYVNGHILERSEVEKQEDINNLPPPAPSKEEILENEILMLTEQNIDLDFRVLMLEFALS